MAKPGRPRKDVLDTTAESIGRTLGKLAHRLDAFRQQRAELASDIRRVVGVGQQLLSELGHAPAAGLTVINIKRKRNGGREAGFKMSAAARRKISLAQKARWAKVKKAGNS